MAAKGKTTKPKVTKKSNRQPCDVRYDPAMCATLISLLSTGSSRAHFCAKYSISYKTFDNWRNANPEFQASYEIAKPKCEAWWQSMAKDHITHKSNEFQLNSVAWSMNMRNRFGWTEHRCIEVPGLGSAKTFNDKFNILTDQIENGKFTSTEVAALTNLLTTGVKIAESVEVMERLEKLEAMLELKKEDEAIG